LGVKKIINAAGTFTALGGSLMPQEVVAAWTAASRSFVDLLKLQDRVGEKIAALLGVEAALVTTGAAGGMLLATAAALTVRDATRIPRLPLPPDEGAEVIRQASHRTCYDQQVQACGVKLVDVETREHLERAIHGRVVMMLSYNLHEPDGKIPQAEWLEMARRHGIPTLLDAAADTPPRDALWKYSQMGYDLVAFSGGKAIRGPQDAGLLLGRKDLISAAKCNTAPHCGTIGRGMKVSKEDMVAMWAAVERYLRIDPDAELREWEQRLATIEGALQGLPLTARRIVPPIANHVPHLLLLWDENRLPITAAQLKQELVHGEPSIATARVHGTGSEGFLVSVFMLEPGEDQIVGSRLKQVFQAALS
jgi:L-seryl-tRNA(Ser) seleniumtransferase